MRHYPLLFTFRDAVSGNGFLAGVTLYGRALMVQEAGDEWCVYGVRPAAIAEVGATPQEAYLRFRNRYKEVLFDFAGESGDFDSFRSKVENFYQGPDAEEEQRWGDAVKAMRAGTVEPEKPLSDLPRRAPEKCPSSIGVTRLDEARRFQASDNISDSFALAEAA